MDLKYLLLTQNSHSDSFLVWQLAPVSYNDNWLTLDKPYAKNTKKIAKCYYLTFLPLRPVLWDLI